MDIAHCPGSSTLALTPSTEEPWKILFCTIYNEKKRLNEYKGHMAGICT
jgi:hypothetical protein